MSEGSSGAGVMDARQFIYLPRWVKMCVLAATAMLLLLAAASVYEAISSKAHGDSLVFYLSVAQSAALVFIFFLIVVFSRRDANVEQLHLLVDEFLKGYVASALRKVSVPAIGISGFDVEDEGAKDIFGRLLCMNSKGSEFRVWV